MDDNFAELHFRWGQCCLSLGQKEEAFQHFRRARDLDTLRFRCDSRLNEIIRTSASNHEAEGIGLADTEAAVGHTEQENVFYEHVHLTFQGNYLVALSLAEQVTKLLPESVVAPTRAQPSWPTPDDCARRLAWTDFSRREAASMMYSRLNDAPFTNQLNHSEQMTQLRRQLEELTPATQPTGLQEAATRGREAIAISTNDWILHSLLGRLEQRLGNFGNAAKSWQRVVESVPYYVEGWEMFGAVRAEQKENDRAQAAFDRALQIEPESINARMGKGQILASEGKYEQAASNFEEVLKIKQYWGPAHLGLAKALEAMGKKQDAEPHFRQALKDRINTPTSYKALGQLCFEKGWLADAAKNFSDALRLEPSDAATHVNLGMTLGMMGRQAEARDYYAEAARLDPNLAEAHARLGLELGRQGDNAGAVKQFAEAVRLKPDYLEARINFGIALTKQQRATEAREQFEEVLRRSPTNVVARKYVMSLEGASGASRP
jgi:tetratricopeptide (TPR) repeat protein